MTLLIDYRESTLLPHLPASGYTEVTLDDGDALWLGNGPDTLRTHRSFAIGMERKRLGDALKCRDDGRLLEQLRGMTETCNAIWIVIEDDIRPNPYSGILEVLVEVGGRERRAAKVKPGGRRPRKKYRYVPAISTDQGRKSRIMWSVFWRWLTSLCWQITLLTGVHTRPHVTRNAKESATWLWAEYNWWQKPWESHKSLKQFNVSQKMSVTCGVCDHGRSKHRGGRCVTCGSKCEFRSRRPPTLVRPGLVARMAKEADDVGWETALVLGERFRSPREMVNAGVEEYEKVRVNGRRLGVVAKSIVAQWSGEHE